MKPFETFKRVESLYNSEYSNDEERQHALELVLKGAEHYSNLGIAVESIFPTKIKKLDVPTVLVNQILKI